MSENGRRSFFYSRRLFLSLVRIAFLFARSDVPIYVDRPPPKLQISQIRGRRKKKRTRKEMRGRKGEKNQNRPWRVAIKLGSSILLSQIHWRRKRRIQMNGEEEEETDEEREGG